MGHFKNRELIILVDSGSTHSFPNKKVAEELKISLVVMRKISIVVSDGGEGGK